MIYCTNCGTANRDGARFCNECGMPLGNLLPCQSCGFQNLSTARFCSNCGAPVALTSTGGGRENQQSMAEEDDPFESDVPPMLEVEASSNLVSHEGSSSVLDFSDLDVDRSADSYTPLAKESAGDDWIGSLSTDSDGFALGTDGAANADTSSVSDQMSDGVPDEVDTISGIDDEPGTKPGLNDLLQMDEISMKEIEETHPPSNGSLPSWLLNEDSMTLAAVDVEKGPTNTSGEWPGSQGLLADNVRDGEGIVLSSALAPFPRNVPSTVDTPALPDAGKVFEMSSGQPWQMMQSDARSETKAADSRTKAKPEKKGPTRFLFLMLFLLFLCVAALLFVYVTQPSSMQNLGNAVSLIEQEAMNLLLRFIK